MSATAALVIVSMILTAGLGEAAEPPRKKFVELGWDIPSTAFLREHWREMEQDTPFDGVLFCLEIEADRVQAGPIQAGEGEGHSPARSEGQSPASGGPSPSGQRLSSQAIWDGRPWKREWLADALADLKSCRFTKFTDNFLRFNATPGNLEWADDSGWAALSDKAAHCAWLLRESGQKGLSVDFESYGAPQFRFEPAKGRSFAEAASLARRRGAELIRAVAKEHPSAVVLALWLNSVNLRAGASDEPEAILASSEYGLLPAFIDGLLDALPATMTLVDGCENGYYMDSAEEYLRAAGEIRSWGGAAIRLVSGENRAKYRQQVQVGFGFYLDMFANSPESRYYFPPLDGSRLARLERNLSFARQAADEYVWVYGEQYRWWREHAPTAKPEPTAEPDSAARPESGADTAAVAGRGRLWEEALPGIAQAIAYARDPVVAARDEVAARRRAGALSNLARSPQFEEPAVKLEGALPAGYASWQDETASRGKFAWDGTVGGGSGRAAGVREGCLIQDHAVAPGETYGVEADCLPRGSSTCTLTVRWQTPEGRWTREQDDRTFGFRPTSGGWRRAFGVVTVPAGVGNLVILLGVQDQLTEDDVCWFDNLALYRLRR